MPVHAVIDGWADAIAAALAEEREKARAPFLALADDLSLHTVEPTTVQEKSFAMGLDTAAVHIRRVAGKTE